MRIGKAYSLKCWIPALWVNKCVFPVPAVPLSTKEDQFSVSIQPGVGELLMPSTMTEQDFSKEQGGECPLNQIHDHSEGHWIQTGIVARLI